MGYNNISMFFKTLLFSLLIIADCYHLLPMWWNIGKVAEFNKNKNNKLIFNNEQLILYNDGIKWLAINDICPHRGASLSHGKFDKKTKCIICPYHGWEFNEGNLVKIPGQYENNIASIASKNNLNLKKYKIKELNNYLYIYLHEKI